MGRHPSECHQVRLSWLKTRPEIRVVKPYVPVGFVSLMPGLNFCGVLLLFIFLFSCAVHGEGQGQHEVDLHWLEGGAPEVMPGTTWGVPWPRGTVAKGTEFTLHTSSGESVPVQSWPLAYWPDGSLKWTAHALGAGSGNAETFTLSPGKPDLPAKAVTVTDSGPGNSILIDTGVMQCRVAKSGNTLIESITRDGKEIARDGKLVCLLQDQPDLEENGTVHSESFTGVISSVTVEQRGPVRAVVKIEGKHANGKGRAWLPFVVRLYFYAGADSIQVMHTIVYDGDQNHDFIRGLGLRLSVPMNGDLFNRYVRFAGENGGLWAEAVRGLTGLRRDPGEAVRKAQIAGLATPPVGEWNPQVSGSLDLIPAFGDFTLFQPTADSFEIRKRTKEGFAWLNSAYGHRAAGLGWLGTPQGGMAFGIRNFWQSCPSQLDIRGATTDNATVTLWLWSPQSHPMDMRFYHDDMGEDTYAKQLHGLDITYEDYEPGFASAYGVARTSEMMLWALPATPTREETVALADALRTPPQIVCRPADYKAAEVFGGNLWGLPDRSTPLKAQIEDQLDFYFSHYQKEVEQRHWYGFWNYGDVMHTYDADRHVWRYDVGGFAWDNSELSTDLWLWYSYLRSGRADVFRMAEAMSRQTGEVDVYHLGRFTGLGTRHGVMHWGDSGKQLRISTPENRRFLYYLTADERVGDLMRDELGAAQRLGDIPANRKLMPSLAEGNKNATTVHMNIGTDWCSVAAAELTEWERTGDSQWRDKLVYSMKSIAALPHGWFSGDGEYDLATGQFSPTDDKIDVSHLSIVFGGVEVNAELLQLLDVPEYQETWLQYCELYNAGAEEQKRILGQDLGKLNLGQAHSRITAYAAWKTSDPKLADRAWHEFFGGAAGLKLLDKPFPVTRVQGPDVLNPIDEAPVSTNAVDQWSLAAIECLGLVGNEMPASEPK
jgi:hypothetical protein